MGTLVRLTAGLLATSAATGWAVVNDKIDVYGLGGGRILQLIDPERAHRFAIFAAQRRWGASRQQASLADDESLHVEVWGRSFSSPIGLAAGFDKNAEAVDGCLAMGFGFLEVGSVTPKPQPGNPKPRVFRLPADRAVINRYGFNSVGLEAFQANLEEREKNPHMTQPGILGVNLGKNKTTAEVDAGLDYGLGARTLAKYADFLVVNVSSPNTPGLRNLQAKEMLKGLLEEVIKARDESLANRSAESRPPILVKIAPDLTPASLSDIAQVVLELDVAGIVVSNTTVTRPSTLKSPSGVLAEVGGLSGPPLLEQSTRVLGELYRLTGGEIPLIGCGGVSSGRDAYDKIRAGASLIELYTALVYDGPRLIPRMKAELAQCLKEDGFRTVQEAVGADHHSSTS